MVRQYSAGAVSVNSQPDRPYIPENRHSPERRRVIAAAATACLCFIPRLLPAQERRLPRYCSVDPDIDLRRFRARSSTGNGHLDRALIAELRNIMKVMPVSPGFRIIDDIDGPNAFAIDRTLISGTRGTALFGINLITEEIGPNRGGYAIAGIAAHECAHIHQFFSPHVHRLLKGQRTGVAFELHADFLAGYYMASKHGSDRNLSIFARSLYEKGDFDFNDVNHHGTPDQRVHAMESGFRSAHRGDSFEYAVQSGIDHVIQ